MYIKLRFWPAITCIWFALTFLISYLIAVFNGNVYFFFPYISDTGALPPESCIFGQMLNIGAVMMGITMYIRHKQVEFAVETLHIEIGKRVNSVASISGLIACLGMSVVANFQETNVGSMHFLGAVMAFGVGSVYFILQMSITTNDRATFTKISYAFRSVYYQTQEYGVSRHLHYTRLFLSAFFLPLFFANTICSSIAFNIFDGDSILWWTEENKGFHVRLAATFTEWIMAIFMLFYIMSFTKELKSIEFKEISFENKCNCK